MNNIYLLDCLVVSSIDNNVIGVSILIQIINFPRKVFELFWLLQATQQFGKVTCR